MLRKMYSDAVRFLLAVNPTEVEELVAELPATIQNDLAAELNLAGEAHKYDLETRCACFLQQLGTGLACWQWHAVETYGQAGRLLAAIIDLNEPMTAEVAERLYHEAMHRPHSAESSPP